MRGVLYHHTVVAFVSVCGVGWGEGQARAGEGGFEVKRRVGLRDEVCVTTISFLGFGPLLAGAGLGRCTVGGCRGRVELLLRRVGEMGSLLLLRLSCAKAHLLLGSAEIITLWDYYCVETNM